MELPREVGGVAVPGRVRHFSQAPAEQGERRGGLHPIPCAIGPHRNAKLFSEPVLDVGGRHTEAARDVDRASFRRGAKESGCARNALVDFRGNGVQGQGVLEQPGPELGMMGLQSLLEGSPQALAMDLTIGADAGLKKQHRRATAVEVEAMPLPAMHEGGLMVFHPAVAGELESVVKPDQDRVGGEPVLAQSREAPNIQAPASAHD